MRRRGSARSWLWLVLGSERSLLVPERQSDPRQSERSSLSSRGKSILRRKMQTENCEDTAKLTPPTLDQT